MKLLTVLLLLAASVAVADWDKCPGKKCKTSPIETSQTISHTSNTSVEVAGDKSDSLGIGLSNSLGDVDIAGCLGSEQWNSVVFGKQKLVLNWPCMAEFYLRNEKYDLAAMAICNTEVVDEFASESECEAAHDFGPVAVPAPAMIIESDDEDEERWREEQQELVIDLQEKIAELEKRPAQQVSRQVVQQPYLTDQQRQALREVKQ